MHIRTLLGLGTFCNQLRFWSTSGSMLLVGLITTAIVAGITPSTTLVEDWYFDIVNTRSIEPCFYTSAGTSNGSFSWKLANGSFLNYNSSAATDALYRCSIQYAPSIFASVPYVPYGDYSYIAGGVPVSKRALGTLFDYTKGGAGFEVALGPWIGPLLYGIEACLPVLVRSPV